VDGAAPGQYESRSGCRDAATDNLDGADYYVNDDAAAGDLLRLQLRGLLQCPLHPSQLWFGM
jgi:hypothetical protein